MGGSTEIPFGNSDILFLLNNGHASKIGGLRISASPLPSNRNIIEVELNDHGAKLLELRTNQTITSCALNFRGLLTFPGAASGDPVSSLLLGDRRQMVFGTTNAPIFLATGAGLQIGTVGASQFMAFWGATPIAQPTGIAVTAEAIHAALVSLGLITA